MPTRIIIPARLHSTRFPKKLLADVNGKPLLWHTYQCALKAEADEVLIATDADEIKEVAEGFGADVVMTSVEHTSGTARLAEVVASRQYDDHDIIINLQGDEPLMPVENLHQVADALDQHTDCAISTICEPIVVMERIMDPHVVKVVRDDEHRALYFSRAPIPWVRDAYPDDINAKTDALRHVGLYAYRTQFLKKYPSLSESSLEHLEALEQLRFLQAGYRIVVENAAKHTPPGVDTAKDLEFIKNGAGGSTTDA